MNFKRQIKLGAFLSYIGIFLNIVAGVLTTPLIIRSIGNSSYAVYSLVFSVINTFLIDLGLGSATSKYIAKYKTENNQTAVNDIFGLILKLFIILSTILTVFFGLWIAFSEHIYKGLTPNEISSFKICLAITAIYSICSFPFVTFDGVLNAYEKFVQAKLITIINRVVLTGSLLVCIFLNAGLYSLIICHAGAALVLVFSKIYFVYRYTPARPNLSFRNKSQLKNVAMFSVWVTVATLANRLIFNICPSILGIVSTSNEIAIFGIITTIESYIYIIVTAINTMFLATVTRIFSRENPKEHLIPLLNKVGKYQFFINGLIVAGFIVLGKTFLQLWVGSDFIPAYYGLVLILVPGLFYNSLQIANTTMIVTDKIKYHAITEIIAGVVNVSLCFPLGHAYGALGISLSICIAFIVRTISDNIICIFILKLPMKSFYLQVYLRMFLPVIVASALGILTSHYVDVASIFGFVRVGLVITFIYIFLSFTIGFSSSERLYLYSRVLKRTNNE